MPAGAARSTGVIEATVAAMEKLGAKRARIVAAAGPMIRQPNYEVGQDLIDRFVAVDPNTIRFFKPAQRAGHAMFDLAGYVVSRLRRAEHRRRSRTSATAPMPIRRSSTRYRRSTHRGGAGLRPAYQRHRAGRLTTSADRDPRSADRPAVDRGRKYGYQFLTQIRRRVNK